MGTEMMSLVFVCLWVTVKGATVATTSPSLDDDKCSSDVFKNCTDKFTSLVNLTSDAIDTNSLIKFYCSPNYTVTINCLKDHLDPTCGPETDAYVWNKTLTAIPDDFSYAKYCQNNNANELEKLLQCQTKLIKFRGYLDCTTGKTLNKTVDITDTCSFLKITMGCTLKYIKITCPDSTQFFSQYSRDSLKKCDVDFETSEEARVCDDNIEGVCAVAYNPPPVNSNSSEITNFICSEKGRGLQTCLHTVYDMCKNNSYFNSSSVDTDIKLYEAQTAMFCSDNSTALKECQSRFSKVGAFQDCITGKTLNTVIDPADTCSFIKNSVACTFKYTDLICPEFLDVFNKSIAFPSICNHNKELGKAATSCDNAMGQVCSAGFNPPMTDDTDAYIDFICSGRAAGYTSCAQKFQKLCYHDTSKLPPHTNDNEHQEKIICSDKTGFTGYMQCLRTSSFKEEFGNCSATKVNENNTMTCRHVSELRCELQSLEKTCSQSARFYRKLHYQTLVSCSVIEATTIGTNAQTTLTSGSYFGVSLSALATVVYSIYIRVLV